MRLVKMSDLSEEERKKALEAQRARLEANRQASEKQRQNANDGFNELVTKTGEYDTSKHTTTMNKVMEAMKKSGASNEKISTFKKANHLTLWDSVLDTMNGLGKIGENTWLGLKNGLKSFQQNIGTQTSEIQAQRADLVHFIDNETMEKLKNNEITEEELKQAENKNNSIIPTGDDIRKENEENIKKFQDEKQKNIEKINKNVEEIDNSILKKVAEVSPSIGQMIPSFIPGAGAVYATGSATGQYYDDAKQRGMTEEEANNYAGIMGLIEGGTEMIGVKNLSKAGKGIKAFVKGTGKEVAKETSEKVSKSVLKQSLKDYGIGIADNVMQEALIDPIDEVVSYGISGETKHDYSTSEGWKELGNDMLQDGINGGLVSAILGGANLGIQSCTGVVQKYRNGENITNEEFKNAVKDAGKELDVSKMVISGVEQQVSKYKDYYSNKPVDNETQNWLNQAENIINNNTETNTNNNQTVNNSINQQNNVNTSSMSFEDSAKVYNIDTNNETVKTVSQVLSNRDIAGRFDENYFKNNNENAIWKTYTDEQGNTKREVIFNPNGNTQDTMQQISIHELTHDLAGTKEFDELKSLVLDRNKTMQGYTEARQSLENTYSQVYDPNSKEFKNLVDEEEVADTLAQKLGDQDFVNSLSTEKPTVFKRIYNWVVDKVNKITGNKIEKIYWEDIKNKFENAYRQIYQGENNQTKYSMQKDSNGNNTLNVPTKKLTNEQKQNRLEYLKNIDTSNMKFLEKHQIKSEIRALENGYSSVEEMRKVENESKQETANNDDIILQRKAIANKLKDKGANVDKDGNITLYHITTEDNYNQINKDGYFKPNDSPIGGMTGEEVGLRSFFSYDKSWVETWRQSANSKVIEIKVPAEYIRQGAKNEKEIYIEGILKRRDNGIWTTDKLPTSTFYDRIAVKEYQKQKTSKSAEKESENNSDSFNLFKEQQLDIIQKTNPMLDDYHTGIRIVDDIKTFKEAYDIAKKEALDGGWDEYASYPDITNDMIENSLKTGEITVYSSNDIKNGTFVTPSYEQALEYAGNDTSKVKSKKVKVDDVAWINLDEGQYAKISTSTIANKQDVLYNINKGSDENGRVQRFQRLPRQVNTRLQQESQQQQIKKFSTEEYKQFEQSIKPIKQNQLTERQKSLIDNYKRQYNKDIVFFDGKNNQGYFGGASLTDSNKIYIDTNSIETFGENKIINHEIMESDIRHNRELSNDIIQPAIQKIINDPKFNEQKLIFWENQNGNIPSDYAIAKDILCDRFAEIKTGEKWDYENVLSQETNMSIDFALDNFYKSIYGKELVKNNTDSSKPSISENNKWKDFLNNQIGERGKGKTVQELRLPTKETINNKKVDSYNVLYQDNEQVTTMSLPVSEGGKVRKHYKSIMQSSNTSPEAKAIAKELMGTDTYVPDSNERQLKIADERIERNGADNEAISLATKVKNGDRITAEDIATGERLIEYYSKVGDKEKLQDSIQNVALAGTQLGQAVQAMSLVNRQTPQGQAVYLQKVVDKMNSEIDRRTKGKGKKFELTPEMIEKITNSSKENLEQNIDEVARELANQVPKTTIEKIDSWRYFSMLANPRTHFRNIIGNFSMAGVQSIKNKVAGGLEAVAQKTGMIDKRTKTLKPANKQTRDFAKADVDNVMARLNNESKFDARNLIQQYQRTFKNNALENTLGKLYNLNSKALEKEDVFGLKRGYRKALADYMTANKLTKEYLTSGTREADIQLEKARKYAIEQAQEATFHQQSAMASMLAQFEKKNTATRLITGAVIPFKKTPINVAKSGASYSPLGLVKSFTLDVVNLKNGKITANQYIDNLAKGLTGTGIATVGYALAQAGILSASGGDDDQKNEYYKEDRGNQAFSIKIGDKTYSLDWLAPTAIPLFIGAELNYNIKNSNEEQTPEDILDRVSNSIDAMSSAMNPMIEMSMLSGLASTIKSFSQGDTQVFQNLAINAGKSYINQFFPTLGGQIARIVDDTERSSTSTKKNAFAKAVDSTGKQILNKIPLASKLLPAKTDVWGNTLKRDSNPLYRTLQQIAFPWSEKELKSTSVDNAVSDLYEETGEKSVLPNTSINKDFTLNGEKYRLTAEEYAEYKKNYGKNSYELLNNLTSSKEYKNMNNEQKTEAISKIYEYANEKNKVDYANKNKVDIETSSLYNTVTSIEKEGGSGSDYFKYLDLNLFYNYRTIKDYAEKNTELQITVITIIQKYYERYREIDNQLIDCDPRDYDYDNPKYKELIEKNKEELKNSLDKTLKILHP